MVSSYTTNKRIEKPIFNDYIDSWNNPVNTNWDLIDKALGGLTTINLTGLSGVVLLSPTQYGALKLRLTGTPNGNTTVTVPSPVGGLWVVQNDAGGTYVESMASAAAPGVLVALPQGTQTLLTCDGVSSGMTLAINAPPVAGGVLTQVQYHGAGGVLNGSSNLTYDAVNARLTTYALTSHHSTVLGDAAGDGLTLHGQSVTAPNGLRFNSDQIYLTDPDSSIQVAFGTTVVDPGSRVTVNGNIKVAGVTFGDGTTQTTAGSGGSGAVAGNIREVQYNGGGVFAAEAGFSYDPALNTLSVPKLNVFEAPIPITSGGTGGTGSTGIGASGVVLRQSPDLTGVPTAPTAASNTNTQQIATAAFVQSAINATRATSTASLSADVLLNDTGQYFTGPSTPIPAGATAVYASGTVTLKETSGTAAIQYAVRLWDGVNVIAGAVAWSHPGTSIAVALSGTMGSPAGSIRISVRCLSSTFGVIAWNEVGELKTSTVTAIRIL